MKFKYLYLSLFFAAVGFLVFSAFSADEKSDDVKGNESIIKFSHQFHAELAECETCHSAVPTSTSLKDRLMPDHENCGSCHEVDNEDNCKTCHYDGVFEPLIQKTSGLIFNHSFHVTDKKMKCETCHKGITKVDYSYQAEQPFPAMEDCYSCHNNITVATNNCESCHISTANLLPQTHRVVDFVHNHKFAAKQFDANCMMCHDNNSCEDCHVATNVITENNTADNFYQPYVPENFKDGAKQQNINRVHDLNYRFTHGIDAKGKTSECQTCHQVETFCTNCHQADNNDYSLSGTVPASHLKLNFTTFGVGSGGGVHAQLARRDIESCVACHDVQGSDPTCITCHTDNDGIKGTNPKTHPANFMKDTHGDWHDNAGSVCFNCHVGASPNSPSGVGFCGYCHGVK
jgi:c(7)-type cytochrome triheme protein